VKDEATKPQKSSPSPKKFVTSLTVHATGEKKSCSTPPARDVRKKKTRLGDEATVEHASAKT